ncbi:hypothetical protein KI387_024077, partial [Taxus chinensis]
MTKDAKRRLGESKVSPFRAVQRNLSQDSPGQLGQKYVEDVNRLRFSRNIGELSSRTVGPKVRVGREKPKEPRANQILPRVFTAKRDKEARIGRFRDFCPRQFGTSGPKVREGREKLKEPPTNQNVPRVR